jgi:hypothetical protein
VNGLIAAAQPRGRQIDLERADPVDSIACDVDRLLHGSTGIIAPALLNAFPDTIGRLSVGQGLPQAGVAAELTAAARFNTDRPESRIRCVPGRSDIASDIRYQSEAAFSRAFRREFGQPPGQYRSDHKGSR